MRVPRTPLCIAWFRRDDWDELKRLCPPGDLEDTYDEWLNDTKIRLVVMDLSEHDIEKVVLTPGDLREWQIANGGNIDTEMRGRLAVEIATKRQNTRPR
jgi:hypothetical protein